MQLYFICEDSSDPCMFLSSLEKLEHAKDRIVLAIEASGSKVLRAERVVYEGRDAFAFTLTDFASDINLVDHWYIKKADIDGEEPVFLFGE